MDEVDAFASEGQALDAYLSELDEDQWRHASLCEGWSVTDVVVHLAQTEEAVVSTFEDGDAGRPFAQHVADAAAGIGGAVDALAEAAVVAERPDDPLEALERWRRAHRPGARRHRGVFRGCPAAHRAGAGAGGRAGLAIDCPIDRSRRARPGPPSDR